MNRITSISILFLGVAACASNDGSWPGGEPPAVYSGATETSEPGPAPETPPAQDERGTTVASTEEIAPSTPGVADVAGDPLTAQAGAERRIVTAEDLKVAFDPVTTRSYVPAYDFDDSLVTFEFNSADVTPDSVAQIDQIGKFFEDPQTEGRTFELVGHTDAAGDAAYNLELSKKRAAAIRAQIIDKYPGVYPNILVDGKGEADPKDPSAERSRVNRRVVLKEVK